MGPKIQPLGDAALRVGLGEGIDPELNRRVRAAALAIERAAIAGVVECVPAYAAVTVHYRPHVVRYAELRRAIETALAGAEEVELPPGRLVEIPVVYDGPDLAFVAEHAGLSVEEVVELHSRPEYVVYMIGFAPGFPYLGGLPERLATPRLEKPRLSVPAGSVGIGGAQTGVYTVESPGGWRLIGRTSAALYDPGREPASLLAAGDRVRFRPVREG
jgi:inhibitor of KinA